MTSIHLDFEAYSEANIKSVGAYTYAAHPSTRILCMAYAVGDNPVEAWTPGEPFPPEFSAATTLRAFNAAFEIAIWKHCAPADWWPWDTYKWRCTSAAAAYKGFPMGLAEVAEKLGAPAQKDVRGDALIELFCTPSPRLGATTRKKLTSLFSKPIGNEASVSDVRALLFPELLEYCRQDVETERSICHILGDLPDDEQAVWEMDLRINHRGVAIDRRAAAAAMGVCGVVMGIANTELSKLTGGAVTAPTEVAKIVAWVNRAMEIDCLTKENVKELLRMGNLPNDVRRVLEIRQEAGKSSTGKITRMLECSAADGRAHDLFRYHGATTGRWAGRGVQPQNMPRPVFENPPVDVDLFTTGDDPADLAVLLAALYGPPIVAVSDALRGMLIAGDGCLLTAGDFSAIEAIVLACLAGEDWKVQAFRDVQAGLADDIYCVTASEIYGYPVRKKMHPKERQVGKIAELASGYQGSIGAWKNFGADKLGWTDEQIAEKVEAWRDRHPAIAGARTEIGRRVGGLWRGLQAAAIRATSGTPAAYRGITYRLERDFLTCQLPSGRKLWYYCPSVEQGEYGPMLTYMQLRQMPSGARAWQKVNSYGGLLTENVVQAVSRDLLVHSMLQLEESGYRIVMHVHDEVVVEMPEGCEDVSGKVSQIMSIKPTWAVDWPIRAETWKGKRYRK